MSSFIYNEAKRAFSSGEINLTSDDIRVILVMTNTTADTDDDVDTIDAIGTLDEMDGANYSRQTLDSETVNEDAANDRAEFDDDNVTWSSLGNGTRDVKGAIVYKHVTNDTDSVPIAFIDFSPNQSPGGSDFTINWDSEGIFYLG